MIVAITTLTVEAELAILLRRTTLMIRTMMMLMMLPS